jgi:MFS family permease
MFLKEKKYAWFLLLFLWFFGFINSLSRIVMAYFQQDITSALGVGRSFLGMTWSTAIFIGAISAPLGGWLVDRIGYKKVMIYASIANILSIAVVLEVQNPAGYFIGFGLIAGLGGIGVSTNYVLISTWFQHHRAKALTILGSASSLGLAVLTPILVSLKSWLQWTTVYTILFFISCLFIPLVLWLVRSNSGEVSELEIKAARSLENETVPSPATKLSTEKIREMLNAFINYVRQPILLVVMFALLTCGISMGTVEMHLMAIHQQAHVSNEMLASALSLLGLLELIGGITFSFLLDYMSRMKALSILYTIRTLAFTFLFLHFPYSPILFSVLFGATYLGAVPGGILVAGEALNNNQKTSGLQIGILIFIHQIGGVLAALGGGMNYDHDHSYQLLILFNIICSLLVAGGYMAGNRRRLLQKETVVSF